MLKSCAVKSDRKKNVLTLLAQLLCFSTFPQKCALNFVVTKKIIQNEYTCIKHMYSGNGGTRGLVLPSPDPFPPFSLPPFSLLPPPFLLPTFSHSPCPFVPLLTPPFLPSPSPFLPSPSPFLPSPSPFLPSPSPFLSPSLHPGSFSTG